MKKRKIPALLAVICCLAALLQPVSAAVVSPNSSFYVYDGGQILSQETEEYIVKTGNELESKTGAQIVVVTIPSLEGQSLEAYATELFRQWGIGDKEKDNGLLLLCAVEDRQFRVEVGYGLEGDLPDGKTGRMQDEYIIPLLKEDKFEEGIKNGYNAFLQEVAAVYDVKITGEEPVSYEEEDIDPAFGICMVIGVMVSTLAGAVFLDKKKKAKKTAAFWAVEGAQVVIMALVLQSLISAIVIVGISLLFGIGLGTGGGGRYRTFHTGGGFGGGRPGGFGGGGGFSGGGGRSGGGGSSRSF